MSNKYKENLEKVECPEIDNYEELEFTDEYIA